MLETIAFNLLTVVSLSTQLKNPKFCVSRPHLRNTTVSLETNPLMFYWPIDSKDPLFKYVFIKIF